MLKLSLKEPSKDEIKKVEKKLEKVDVVSFEDLVTHHKLCIPYNVNVRLSRLCNIMGEVEFEGRLFAWSLNFLPTFQNFTVLDVIIREVPYFFSVFGCYHFPNMVKLSLTGKVGKFELNPSNLPSLKELILIMGYDYQDIKPQDWSGFNLDCVSIEVYFQNAIGNFHDFSELFLLEYIGVPEFRVESKRWVDKTRLNVTLLQLCDEEYKLVSSFKGNSNNRIKVSN